MKIGSVIRQLRKEKNLTLEELAFAVGSDAANLSRVERDKQNPSQDLLEKISAVFDFPLSRLYLMVEQNQATYQLHNPDRQPPQLERFVVKFMLLSTEHQQLIDDIMGSMLKLQK